MSTGIVRELKALRNRLKHGCGGGEGDRGGGDGGWVVRARFRLDWVKGEVPDPDGLVDLDVTGVLGMATEDQERGGEGVGGSGGAIGQVGYLSLTRGTRVVVWQVGTLGLDWFPVCRFVARIPVEEQDWRFAWAKASPCGRVVAVCCRMPNGVDASDEIQIRSCCDGERLLRFAVGWDGQTERPVLIPAQCCRWMISPEGSPHSTPPSLLFTSSAGLDRVWFHPGFRRISQRVSVTDSLHPTPPVRLRTGPSNPPSRPTTLALCLGLTSAALYDLHRMELIQAWPLPLNSDPTAPSLLTSIDILSWPPPSPPHHTITVLATTHPPASPLSPIHLSTHPSSIQPATPAVPVPPHSLLQHITPSHVTFLNPSPPTPTLTLLHLSTPSPITTSITIPTSPPSLRTTLTPNILIAAWSTQPTHKPEQPKSSPSTHPILSNVVLTSQDEDEVEDQTYPQVVSSEEDDPYDETPLGWDQVVVWELPEESISEG
eukprot:CAMPEP_0184686698 /NCGR_PEP_ID=MMETSP0312-20130426/23629_1 /TAXON_ID=31354 /ORGANISM="Compsopogon coeruleus, Strain SAG 36.94" /LENGTH=486 /DNA_ID=CAMNT_0027142083 /DNA_START=82 /DNA_END=1542 /DNA_ORIENTATION=-